MLWAVKSPWNSDSNENGEGADKDLGKGGDERARDGGKGARNGGTGARDGGEGGANGSEGVRDGSEREDVRSSSWINGRPEFFV